MKTVFDRHKEPIPELKDGIKNCKPPHLLAGVKFWWQDFLWNPSQDILMNKKQLELVKKQLPPLDPPSFFPYTLTFAIHSAEHLILEHKGKLKRVSPDEPVHQAVLGAEEPAAQAAEQPLE